MKKKKPTKKYKKVTITLPPSTIKELERIAKKTERPKSQIIKKAIEQFSTKEYYAWRNYEETGDRRYLKKI